MNQLADRLNRLSTSQTLAMSQKSSELKAQGIDVINLSVGEPDFTTPEHIKAAAVQAIADNYSYYSPVPGYPALRNAIVAKLKNENGLTYTAGQISVSNGAKQCVCNALMCLVNPGDEVIIPAPYWVSYPEMVKLADGNPVFVSAGIEQNFKITPKQLEDAITPKTKAFILCSPSNPTGSVYSKEELAGLAEVLARHPEIIIISDEIYEHINYIGSHASLAQFPALFDHTIVVNGVSKAYAMTGWRIGFLAGPEWIVKGCNKLQGQYTSGACSISQKAAEAAYTETQKPVGEMREAFMKRRDLIVKLAKEIPGFEVNVPDGAFYIFPKCSYYYGKSFEDRKINNSNDLAMYLLEVGHVACVGGAGFGAPDCIRMSYATSEDNIRVAFHRIKETLAKLN
jgi:aspartate aminotransferase